MIFTCLIIFLIGTVVGAGLMSIASIDGYDEAVSDAFYIGYEKGKEEEKNRFMRKLDEYEKGECES